MVLPTKVPCPPICAKNDLYISIILSSEQHIIFCVDWNDIIAIVFVVYAKFSPILTIFMKLSILFETSDFALDCYR